MIRLWLISLSTLLLLSCGGAKESIPVVQVKDLTAQQIIHLLEANSRAYNWIELSGKIKFNTEDNKFSGGILIRSKRDSMVWARIKKLGVEGARIQSDKSGMTVLNRIDKTVMIGSYDDIREQSGSDFELSKLCDILSADPYLPEKVHYVVSIDSQEYVLFGRQDHLTIEHRVRAYDFQLTASAVYDEEGRGLSAAYSDYVYAQDSSAMWPKLRMYTLSDGIDRTNIELKIKNIKTEGPLNMPFSIPPHYERVR